MAIPLSGIDDEALRQAQGPEQSRGLTTKVRRRSKSYHFPLRSESKCVAESGSFSFCHLGKYHTRLIRRPAGAPLSGILVLKIAS